MPKKKSLIVKFFTFIGHALAWIVINFFRALWFLLSGFFKALYSAVKSAFSAAKSTHHHLKTRHEQPKTPADFKEFAVSSTVKGSIDSFTHRLLNESLILAIAGRRGSGKSVLGFRLLENIYARTKRPCYALGVKQSVIPDWIATVESVDAVSNGGALLIDEGAVSFNSRDSMSKKNKGLGELLAIARHKDLTLIFITQNTGMIDKNVLNLCDTILLKEGSLLQEKMERSVMKDLYQTANESLSKLDSQRRKSCCYIFDSEFEGLISTELPSFWSQKVSKNQA